MKLAKEKKKKHHLTVSTDPLLSELRDLNFSAVGKKLSRVAHRLDEDYKVGRHILRELQFSCSFQVRHQAKTVAQLREFVGRLGGLQTEHQSLRLRQLFQPFALSRDSVIVLRHWDFGTASSNYPNGTV
jgi:vacuolar protein sorting-associated protein 33A